MNTLAPVIVAEIAGYFFWQDATGFYGCSKSRGEPPSHCGYKNLDALMALKGIRK